MKTDVVFIIFVTVIIICETIALCLNIRETRYWRKVRKDAEAERDFYLDELARHQKHFSCTRVSGN